MKSNLGTGDWLVIMVVTSMFLGMTMGMILGIAITGYFNAWNLLGLLPGGVALFYATKMFFSKW